MEDRETVFIFNLLIVEKNERKREGKGGLTYLLFINLFFLIEKVLPTKTRIIESHMSEKIF